MGEALKLAAGWRFVGPQSAGGSLEKGYKKLKILKHVGLAQGCPSTASIAWQMSGDASQSPAWITVATFPEAQIGLAFIGN